jgi:class 3 adenylate cyclase
MTAPVLFADPLTRPVTFVFTDIVGSTEKLTALGEATWLRALRDHNYVVQDVIDAYGGNAHKFLGDGWMVTFASPYDAVAAAAAIQRELSRDPSPDGFRVRIGVHTGTALTTGDDFLGKDVVLASRITREAGAGEIVASADVLDMLGDDADRFDGGRIAHLKGLGPHLVFGVRWKGAA